MAGVERGQTFLDKHATNIQHSKHKYFIALSSAESEGDQVVCFVMNTELRASSLWPHCNREIGKFVLGPAELSFITHETSIMLKKEVYYEYEDFFSDDIMLFEIASETLQRQIKNCIDFDYLLPHGTKLIKDSFKD
jgi:hypothetical protein